MICLLTGATGFLGKIISKHTFLSNTVFGLSRRGSHFNYCLEKEAPFFNIQFDLVIHAAGKAHHTPKTEAEKQEFYQVNVIGTYNLLKGLENSGLPSQFVFISSVSVYGLDMGQKIDETHPLGAKDPLGLTKIQAEYMVLDWCKKYNIVCTILRLPLIAGAYPPGNLGDMIKGIKKGYYFNIKSAECKKSIVLAEDVAKSIVKVASIGGIYNLTDGYHPSFFELSENISRQLGKNRSKNLPLWLAKGLALTGDLFGEKAPLNSAKLLKITSDLTFDDSKAREAFGWHPTPVLEGFIISDKN